MREEDDAGRGRVGRDAEERRESARGLRRGFPGLARAAHDERVALVVHAHLDGLLAAHRLLAGGAEEGGHRPDLRSGAHAVDGTGNAGGHHRGGDGEDREDHHQLHEGEAARHFTSQEVMSAFSPSPPGAPSAPVVQMS